MSRIALALLILYTLLASPGAVFRCLEARELWHTVDPCLDDLPVYITSGQFDHASQTHILYTAISGAASIAALLSLACVAMLYRVKGISFTPLTPPPRQA